MKTHNMTVRVVALLALASVVVGRAADDKVATAVYANISNGYKRDKAKDGSFKPEYYALSNGGLVIGTTSDLTVDRVSYPEVAKMAMTVLARQNYHYAKSKEQAKLLLVLNWGSTLAPNGMNKEMNVANAKAALGTLQEMQEMTNRVVPPIYDGQDVAKNAASGFNRNPAWATNEEMAVVSSAGSVESSFFRSLTDDRVRDQLNQTNARVLGYQDDLADSNDIRRHAGGGDRYNDLITDVEESRYYIVISAYDFQKLTEKNDKKLLWQVRVSVRSPGNAFDDSLAAMLKSASKYFGRSSGNLVRDEETKGTVELGELKYIGEAKETEKTPTKKK